MEVWGRTIDGGIVEKRQDEYLVGDFNFKNALSGSIVENEARPHLALF